MCNIIDIKILVCNQEPKYLRAVKQSLLNIGLRKIFTADSHEQIDSLCEAQMFDVVLIDTDFNDTGGFYTGDLLLKKFPDIFVLYITDTKNKMDPIESIFSGAVAFIIKNDIREMERKVSLWSNVAINIKNVREILDVRIPSAQRIYT